MVKSSLGRLFPFRHIKVWQEIVIDDRLAGASLVSCRAEMSTVKYDCG